MLRGWRKVPESAVERLRPWDEDEVRRREEGVRLKCEAELDKIDWDLMKKHIRTPEASQAYQKLCSDARSNIVKVVTDLVSTRRPDPYVQYYYGEFAYFPSKGSMIQKRLPLFKKVGLGLGLGLVAASGALKLFENKKELENCD